MSGRETTLRKPGSLSISNCGELLAANAHRAAYDGRGRVIRQSQRLWGLGDGQCPDPVPDHIESSKVIEAEVDEIVWGGFFTFHYGHFLSESTARLWPLLPGGELEGTPVVFSTPARTSFISEWEGAFGLRVVKTCQSATMRFRNAYIPEPAWRMSAWIAPEMRDIHLHARSRMKVSRLPRTQALWLSRTLLEPKRRIRDEALCQWLLGDRIKVIHPETLSLARQVGEIEACSGLVGPIGSAFHTVLLARTVPECVYLAPSRTASSFPAQDALLGKCARFVHVLTNDSMSIDTQDRHPYRLLIPETLRTLASTLLPDLFDDSRLAHLAYPERSWSFARRGSPRADEIETMIGRVLLDPNRLGARMDLGSRFEEEGALECAAEQFAAVADLAVGYAYASTRAARALTKLGRKDEALKFAKRALTLEPGSTEAAGYVEAAVSD